VAQMLKQPGCIALRPTAWQAAAISSHSTAWRCVLPCPALHCSALHRLCTTLHCAAIGRTTMLLLLAAERRCIGGLQQLRLRK
jgi:hypothetical protein